MTWRAEGHGRWMPAAAGVSPFSPSRAKAAPLRGGRLNRSRDRQSGNDGSLSQRTVTAAAEETRPATPRRQTAPSRPAPPVPDVTPAEWLRPKAGPAERSPRSWVPTVPSTRTVSHSSPLATSPQPSAVPPSSSPPVAASSSASSSTTYGPALPERQLLQGASAKERKAQRTLLRNAAHKSHLKVHFRSEADWPPPICNRSALPWGETVTEAACSCTALAAWITKHRADPGRVLQVEFFHDAAGSLVRVKRPIHQCSYWRPGGTALRERFYYSGLLHRALAIKYKDAWRLVVELN